MEMNEPFKNDIVIKIRGLSKHSAVLEVGAYDPDRWEEGVGDIGFGMGAEIYVQQVGFGDDSFQAGVTIGGIGTHSPDTALLRIEAYRLATQIAQAIQWEVDARHVNTLDDIELFFSHEALEANFDTKVID